MLATDPPAAKASTSRLVVLVGVSTAVDGVVQLLEPPGARLVLLGEHLAVGHLPLEAGGLLQGEHCCVGAGNDRRGRSTGRGTIKDVSKSHEK